MTGGAAAVAVAGAGGGGGMGGGLGRRDGRRRRGHGWAGGMAGGAAGGLVIINRVSVPGPRQVLLHVKIAELNRTAIRNLGISWLDTKGQIDHRLADRRRSGRVDGTSAVTHGLSYDPRGLLSPLESTSTSRGTLGQPAGRSSASSTPGSSRCSSTPCATTPGQDPGRAEPDGARRPAGPVPRRRPVPVPGPAELVDPRRDGGRHVQFRRFGTILNFLPQILPNDVIRLDVEPVFSQLNFTPGHARSTAAGSRRSLERSARTVVELREGQTLAIAGLLQLTTNATTVRIPGLGDLPIVGPWFSNNTIETVETETIILVTPELVAPLEKNEVTEAPGDRVYPAQRRGVLLPRPDRGQARPRVPGDQGRAGPAEPHEALPQREAMGGRPARIRRLSVPGPPGCRDPGRGPRGRSSATGPSVTGLTRGDGVAL